MRVRTKFHFASSFFSQWERYIQISREYKLYTSILTFKSNNCIASILATKKRFSFVSGTMRWCVLLQLIYFFIGIYFSNVCAHTPPPPLSSGEGALILLPNFQKGGLDNISAFTGGLLGKRGDSFQGGKLAIWTLKINKNLKYLTRKKVYKQTFFSVITKNLNGEF